MNTNATTGRMAFLESYAEAPDGFRVAYTDGSSTGLSDGAAGWSWFSSDVEWGAGGLIQGTNNVAELMGMREALRYFPKDMPLVIVSDSQYAINSVCRWYRGWVEKGWVNGIGVDVSNRELICQTREALDARTAWTLVKHVRGHGKDPDTLPSDFEGNKMADMLAKSARLAASSQGEDVLLDPFAWNIIHGRGRKKNAFLETVKQTAEAEQAAADKKSGKRKA